MPPSCVIQNVGPLNSQVVINYAFRKPGPWIFLFFRWKKEHIVFLVSLVPTVSSHPTVIAPLHFLALCYLLAC